MASFPLFPPVSPAPGADCCPRGRPPGHVPRPAVARLPPLLRPRQRRAGRHGHTHQARGYLHYFHYLHNIYTLSKHYLHIIYIHNIYTIFTASAARTGWLTTSSWVRGWSTASTGPGTAAHTTSGELWIIIMKELLLWCTCVCVCVCKNHKKLFNSIGTLERYFYLLQLH